MNMTHEVLEHMKQLIGKSERILVAIGSEYNVDAVASAVVMAQYLASINKEVTVACEHRDFVEQLAFLPGVENFTTELDTSNRLVLKLDISSVQVKEFSYDIKDDALNIYITPESGSFRRQDVTAFPGDFKYDLVITLDAPNLNSLGRLFTEQSEFFYAVPIINVDHHRHNEHYGQVNYTQLSACSVTEMLYEYLIQVAPATIDQQMATALLTGIVSKTRSFKHEAVSPRCLQISADLMAKGARKEQIIRELYQKRSVHVLKVWGKILSRLQHDEAQRLFSSYLTADDIAHMSVRSHDIVESIEHLLMAVPQCEVIVISYPHADGVKHIIWANRHHDALLLSKPLGTRGSSDVAYSVSDDASVAEGQRKVLQVLENRLRQR